MDGMQQPGKAAGQPEQQPQQQPQGQDADVEMTMRGTAAIKKALFADEKASEQFVKAIRPDDAEGSITQTAITLVTQIDQKLNLPERVLAPLIVVAVGELMDLAEAAHGITFDDQQKKRVVMAAWEGLLLSYDADPRAAAQVAASADEQTQQQAVQEYKQAMDGAPLRRKSNA